MSTPRYRIIKSVSPTMTSVKTWRPSNLDGNDYSSVTGNIVYNVADGVPTTTVSIQFVGSPYILVKSNSVTQPPTGPNTGICIFTITGNASIEATNFNGQKFNMAITYVPITATPLKVTFQPPHNSVITDTPLNVVLTAVSPAVTQKFFYTLDGTVPSTSSMQYNGSSITVNKGCTLRVYSAIWGGVSIIGNTRYMDGESQATYIKSAGSNVTLDCKVTPSNATPFTTDQLKVTLATKPQGAKTKIYYTTDGVTVPTQATGFLYTYNKPIVLTGTTILKIKVFPDLPNPASLGAITYIESPLIECTYNKYGECNMPSITPGTTNFNVSLTVTMTNPSPTEEIRYTLDGTGPKKTSLKYTAPFLVTNTTTVWAQSFDTLNIKPPSTSHVVLYTFNGVGDLSIEEQSNILETTIGLKFIVVKQAGGYACRMYVPKFPRTVVNGDLLGKFHTMGVVKTTTLMPLAIFLIEETGGFGALLCTIFFIDDTVKYFRSVSNGKVWADVSEEFV